VKIDPRGTFVYVANFSSSTIGTYVINTATGALSGAGSNQSTATGPNCITIDPALGIYLYTSNQTDNSISAEKLDPHSGALGPVQGTQFTSAGFPTCLVAVANGAHATQIVE
jgi:6-phosphogluconolactonase